MPPSPDPFERVASDPLLRQAIEAARSWGVSPSRFLGAETTTRHEYDVGHRLARSVTSPEWTPEDRDLVFALMAWEAQLCPGCQHPLAETLKPENEERYVAAPAMRCHRCTAVAINQEKNEGKPHPSALLLSVHLVEPESGGADDAP